MTITPDQAKTLLDTATAGIWTTDRDDPDEVFRILSIRKEKGGLVTGTPIADFVESDGDAAMILSAPDLARTVIDQAEEIEKLRSTVAAFINKRTEVITALLNSPEANADYWRWQGHAESRRQIAEALDWTVPHNPGETTSQEADQ